MIRSQVAVVGGDEIAALPAVLDTVDDPHDVTRREDASRVRTGHVPQNLAAIGTTVISLFRLLGHDSIAEAHRI